MFEADAESRDFPSPVMQISPKDVVLLETMRRVLLERGQVAAELGRNNWALIAYLPLQGNRHDFPNGEYVIQSLGDNDVFGLMEIDGVDEIRADFFSTDICMRFWPRSWRHLAEHMKDMSLSWQS